MVNTMKLQTMQEAKQALQPYYEVAKRTTGKDITVERVARLMAHVGNPEQKLNVVHVAGTSGKTSTTTYIAALLHAAGNKVGHTISPHVSSLTERVQIDGKPLEEQKFLTFLGEFLELVKGAPETPSWFELIIAFALWVFAREDVDYAVIETGMGGLHDATNVCNLPDKVCVITDIGLDHTQWLGTTLAQIAGQKAGIIHPGNAVFMYEQSPEIMQVVKFKTNQTKKAELYVQHEQLLANVYGQEFADTMPLYQRRNWLLAYAVYRYLVLRDGLSHISSSLLHATQSSVAGRMEHVQYHGKTIILDGAHNTPKMRAFVDSFKAMHAGKKVPVLIALKDDKEEAAVGPIISEISSEVITTAFRGSQDWPVHAHNPAYLASILTEYVPVANVTNDSEEGLKKLLATKSDLVIVTGSLYLLAEVRERLLAKA